MSGQPKYFKFQVPYGNIHQVLQNGNYKRVIFHIDLPSIARGFYNTDVIHLELANYVESFNMHQLTGQPVENPKIMFDEAAVFMNNLYTRFSNYSPYFIVFYDDGKCKQNKVIWNGYKADRISGLSKILTEDAEREVFRCIKDYYYSEFVSKFTIPNVSKVLYWKEYEADLIPHFIIKYQLLDSHNPETLNVILSTDKDLLQTCVFKNVLQISTLYLKKNSKLQFNVLNDETAISYIYKNFQRGILTSEYIPLMLALMGDKADYIPGISGVGPAKAYNLIISHKLPPVITDHTPLPGVLEEHRKVIVRNLKLISFDAQLSRIKSTEIEFLKQYFQN